MQDGYADAIKAIDSGAATRLLTNWVTVSQRLAR
jgi:anthranilate phosphoribosyltransferase